ncbi:hypothetical protein [Arthrobacter sp. Br18]|uniref:DUF7793 family protein n=1 Tax=Arthrobacter sp. Br18 TaxID=1312954 RepID=UPI00138AB8E5|nr:hypothetical protein [Arthrobacter sp. Br18]
MSAANGKAWISSTGGNALRLGWEPAAQVGVEDARSVVEMSTVLAGGRPYVLLVDLTMLVSISTEAREVFNACHDVLAAAMVGHGPMDRVLAAPSGNAGHPTRFFTSESEALSWLDGLNSGGTDS